MDILNLFKKRSRLYAIELSDMKINQEIFTLIGNAEKHLTQLAHVINEGDFESKDSKLSELENSLLIIKSKVDSLRTDIETILSIEINNKDFITVHDDGYLEDKRERLARMSQALEDLVDLIMARPALEDLRANLLDDIYARVNYLIENINNVMADDKYLTSTYEKIHSL